MRRRSLFAALGFAAAAFCPLFAHAQATDLNFGIISTETSSNLKAAWQPLLEDMQKATGVKINAFFASDYAGIIEAMRFGKVQVAWYGNKSAMEAIDRADGEIFAKVVGKDGNAGYYSLLVVNADSPLKSLDDVVRLHATLNLGFGDPNSTSGTAVPGLLAFGRNGLDPLKDFKRVVRANHETNLLAVVNKQVDVATNNTENLARFETTHPDEAKRVRVIWRSPMIASDPLVWRKDLDAGTKKKLRDFILGYGKDAREKAILLNLTYSGFAASTNAQLVPIRQIELARERSRIEGDGTMAAAEKAQKLKDIDTQMNELARQVASAN